MTLSTLNSKLLSAAKAGKFYFEGSKYTSHCFRRGGAQYRFMYANRKFPLNLVRQWGGWSQGESIGTITKYLFQEILNKETSISDLLDPDINSSEFTLLDETCESVSRHHYETRTGLSEILAEVSRLKDLIVSSLQNRDIGLQTTNVEDVPDDIYRGVKMTFAIPTAKKTKDVIKQWNEGFPGSKPLKDYDQEQRNPSHLANATKNKFTSLYSQRKRIGEEYNQMTNNGENEAPFWAVYGDMSIGDVNKEISRKRKRQQ